MPDSWNRMRAAALDSIIALRDLLADPTADDRRLVAGYVESKRILASAFEAFAAEKYADPTPLKNVKREIEGEMSRLYPGVPPKYLKVRGYGESHSRLLAYLLRRVGAEVTSAELRMLTGD